MTNIDERQICKKGFLVRLKLMRGLISWRDEQEKPELKHSSIFIFSSKNKDTAVREMFLPDRQEQPTDRKSLFESLIFGQKTCSQITDVSSVNRPRP